MSFFSSQLDLDNVAINQDVGKGAGKNSGGEGILHFFLHEERVKISMFATFSECQR